jgi:UDP-N-acetylglucosamine 2-epimerase
MSYANLTQIPRAEMAIIARSLHLNLKVHQKKAGKEPSLDAFLPELGDIADRLSTHVIGKSIADAARTTRLAVADAADDEVDTWLRHTESYLFVEGHRRTGDMSTTESSTRTSIAARLSAFCAPSSTRRS